MLDSSVDLGLGAERARRHRRVPYRGESGAARPGEFQDIWIDPREAAGDIREGFGPEKAIGSLIGKEFLNVLEAVSSTQTTPTPVALVRTGRSSLMGAKIGSQVALFDVASAGAGAGRARGRVPGGG